MFDVRGWIELGRRILTDEPEAHYRAVHSEVVLSPITLPQPGVVGPDYAGLTVLGMNPGRHW